MIVYKLQKLISFEYDKRITYSEQIKIEEKAVAVYFKVPKWHSYGGAKEIIMNHNQDRCCPCRDPIYVPPEYRSQCYIMSHMLIFQLQSFNLSYLYLST
jgi:hypothetical protein